MSKNTPQTKNDLNLKYYSTSISEPKIRDQNNFNLKICGKEVEGKIMLPGRQAGMLRCLFHRHSPGRGFLIIIYRSFMLTNPTVHI